jgi:hypothetical protein
MKSHEVMVLNCTSTHWSLPLDITVFQGQGAFKIHKGIGVGSMVQRMTPNGRPVRGKRGVGMYTRVNG